MKNVDQLSRADGCGNNAQRSVLTAWSQQKRQGGALPFAAKDARLLLAFPVRLLLFRRRALHRFTVDSDLFARLLAFAGFGDGVWRLRESDRGERCYGESGGYQGG